MKATVTLPLLSLLATAATATPGRQRDDHPHQLTGLPTRPRLSISKSGSDAERDHDLATPRFDPLEALQHGLDVMQSEWFELWVGTWPTAIDWTAAVLDTHLVASLSTLSKALASLDDVGQSRDVENDLNHYFSQNVAYYFGEDAFSLRNQAYDDMLWVVLGWLESIKFIESHSERHYCPIPSHPSSPTIPSNKCANSSTLRPWQGAQFVSAFGHRARIFYDIASTGWDDRLCGGGMVWSPYLAPYKNAITNELFIAASIGMYLHFPGDNNSAPFLTTLSTPDPQTSTDCSPGSPHDPAHLRAAVRAYDWLKHSHMRNHLGLYVDGFHVSNWRHGGTHCDIRNEQLFTYNQGVVLSALRGLWEGTGDATYLHDAHALVRDVVRATGWSLQSQRPVSGAWSGLGRGGVLEDRCDPAGACSQDAQTFKGIFFHHMAQLCEALPLEPRVPGTTFAADEALAALHRQSCREYAAWTARNARAAMETRDAGGRFGMWWGVHSCGHDEEEMAPPVENGAVDYRNDAAALSDPVWRREPDDELPRHVRHRVESQTPLGKPRAPLSPKRDCNDRGRGRTVETQTGGIAVLRALWELLHLG